MRRLTLSVLLALSALTVQAEIYRWVDDQGVTQYSQTPPTGRDASTVKPPPAPSIDPEQARREQQRQITESLDDYLEDRALAKEKRAKAEEDQARKDKNCEAGRFNLSNLQSDSTKKIVRQIRKPDGTIVPLSDDERQQKIKEAEAVIKENCR